MGSDPALELIDLAGGTTPVVWRRSARARRVSLRIEPRGGSVVVTLPMRASRAAGLRLLTEHAGWVTERLRALPPATVFAEGGAVPVDGVPHPIRHVPGGTGGAWIDAGEILVSGGAEFLPRRVGELLQREARRRLGELVRAVAVQTGLQPARVTFRDTRSRWGSCTAKRTVMFNWRLVMAPQAIQHYVVVHELAHIRHMDHGPAFWALVAAGAPDMAECVAWLKRHGPALMRAGL